MKNKKVTKLGRYIVAIAVVLFMIVPAVVATQEDVTHSQAMDVIPPGMSYVINYGELEDGSEYIPEFDEFQTRESALLSVDAYTEVREGVEVLCGHHKDIVIYFPAFPSSHNLRFEGYIQDTMINDEVRQYNYGETFTWTTNMFGAPLLLHVETKLFHLFEGCKKIIIDFNYYEDGIYVRHVHKCFRDWSYYPVLIPVVSKLNAITCTETVTEIAMMTSTTRTYAI